ncbi:MAG TPA: hypothetical protein VFU81_17670 [Thermomicrobiales bacterium]|nr:hypothetical protein [Thermomicrobiales bacterium]
MDATRFDALLRHVGHARSRRAFLAAALAGFAVSPAVTAKHKTKPTKTRKRPKPCAGPFSDVAGLQDLVDGARAKSTVRLCAGTFTNTGVTIRKNLTLVGVGKDQTVLQGRWPAPGSALTVAAGAKVTLKSLSVASNYNGADKAVSHGGGILNQGRLTVTGCAVSGNYAQDGGGLYNDEQATLTLNDAEVFDNNAAAELGWGGGIFNNHGTLTVNDAVVTGNEGFDGGGIGAMFGTTILNGTKITGNRATWGGGIETLGESGRLEVRNGSVIGGNGAAGNSAFSGGGLYNGTITVFEKGTLVTGNSLTHSDGRRGGGILSDGGVVTLPDTTIVTGNLPTNCGGPDGGDSIPLIANCVDACQPYGAFCRTAAACCDGYPCTANRCRLP